MNSCEVDQKSSGRLAADAVAAVLEKQSLPGPPPSDGRHARPATPKAAGGRHAGQHVPTSRSGCALSTAGTQRADTPNQEGATARCVHGSRNPHGRHQEIALAR
ncbi:hypothetical protein AVXHC19_05490 [Acidovorax sacchari]